MYRLFTLITAIAACGLLVSSATAQPTANPSTQQQTSSFTTRRSIDESTPIFDKETGKRISLKEFSRLQDADPNGYHLEPIFDEYGKVSRYQLRATNAEEKQTHQIRTRDPAWQPKVSDAMPSFVMRGIDKQTYRSTDSKGRVVVLFFWLNLRKPFWNADQGQRIADLMRPSKTETEPIALGVLNSSEEEISELLKTQTLPFIPIPDSIGFHQKFSIMTFPSFLVIDRNGKVAAFIEGSDYEQLKQVLAKVSR